MRFVCQISISPVPRTPCTPSTHPPLWPRSMQMLPGSRMRALIAPARRPRCPGLRCRWATFFIFYFLHPWTPGSKSRRGVIQYPSASLSLLLFCHCNFAVFRGWLTAPYAANFLFDNLLFCKHSNVILSRLLLSNNESWFTYRNDGSLMSCPSPQSPLSFTLFPVTHRDTETKRERG